MSVFEWDFDFRASDARDPQAIEICDGETGQAYDFGSSPELRLRFGRKRAAGAIPDPIGTFASGDGSLSYEVSTADGQTWNKITFDPPPGSALHGVSAGRYPFDLDIRHGGAVDFDVLADGVLTVYGGAQS